MSLSLSLSLSLRWGGGEAAWSPASLPDLFWWLDATDNATITYGTPPSVATWADKAGPGPDASQVTAGNRPVVAAAAINGLQAMQPDSGTAHYFNLPANCFDALTAGEIFCVVVRSDDVTAMSLWTIGGSGQAEFYSFSDGNIYEDFGSSTRPSSGNPTADLSEPHIYNVIATGSEFTINIDGVQHYTRASNTVAWAAAPKLFNNGGGFIGYCGEIVMTSAKLSADDRTAVLDYLGAKWGIAVP